MLDTFSRLLRLLALLQAQRFWSGSELADRLEVTQRTVRRDVDRLRSLGYPVESSVGVAGGYQLGVGAVLPPLLLDDDEAVAVALGLRTAASGTVSGMEEAALRALAKLERVLPGRLGRRMRGLHASVTPLYWPSGQVSVNTLTTLAAACDERQRAAFRYADRRGTPSERRVEPHALVHTGARWYLLAWDLDRDDWRTFRVDRVEAEPQRGDRFLARAIPGGDAAAHVARAIAARPFPVRARVLIHAPREQVAQQIPPLAGHLEARGTDRCVLETGAHSLTALAFYLGSLGEDFEVLEPTELVDHIAQLAARLSRAAGRHGGTQASPAAPENAGDASARS